MWPWRNCIKQRKSSSHNTEGNGQDSKHVLPEYYSEAYRFPPDWKGNGLNTTGLGQDYCFNILLIISQ